MAHDPRGESVAGLLGDPQLSVSELLGPLGVPFVVFDDRTQDSGHVSYGIDTPVGRRLFVKTTTVPGHRAVGAEQREARLLRAARLQEEVDHPALVSLLGVIRAVDGVMVVHAWFEGELLRGEGPTSALQRFQQLPLPRIMAALDTVIDLHVRLEEAGWIAGDFYDGCLMYDFATDVVKLIDLESYHHGSFVNRVGRLPGSTRFMAPEEHRLGMTIDARTTVFNLGRMLQELLPSPAAPTLVRELAAWATAPSPDHRPRSVAQLQQHWRAATEGHRR